MAIVVVRDSDRGSDYKQGDIVDSMDDTRSDEAGNLVRRYPQLPSDPPFWVIRVEGVDKAGLQFLTEVQYDSKGNVTTKRVWMLRQQNVPANVKNFFLAHRFCGFGGPEDTAFYGATVAGDTVIPWDTARTWIYNKVTHQTA